jgi:hypothetical protein
LGGKLDKAKTVYPLGSVEKHGMKTTLPKANLMPHIVLPYLTLPYTLNIQWNNRRTLSYCKKN